MATQKVSKTAKASDPATKQSGGKFEMSADAARVIPLANGECAYVLTGAGTTVHTRVNSDEFIDGIGALAGTSSARPTLAVLQACAQRFANPGWSRAVAIIQGLPDPAAVTLDAMSADGVSPDN